MPSGSGNNERHPNHPNHTGTIPKTKVRNNCNVPQEAVTPTRRDMATNMVSTSLDWVPVSEYNSRGNYNQSRKQTNNTASDQELNDLDNAVSFESGFGRFVPVRPQPRALPLNVQNQNIGADSNDDGAGSSTSNHSLNPYAHQMQNGLMPHSNHAAAAVMIVNPTTPNAVTGSMSQPFNAPNQNRNNLTRNLNPARNTFEGNSHLSNNNSNHPTQNSRSTKTVNIMNNMYDPGQGSFNNLNENTVNRESARALGEALVAACPDAAAVERRLGQIREYIRVTSSLVDTMRTSEDEAYIEHTKEEYDELVQMVMKLKESEAKLVTMLDQKAPDNVEVPEEEHNVTEPENVAQDTANTVDNDDKTCNIKNNNDNTVVNNNLKKVTNLENEQLNKTLHTKDDAKTSREETTAQIENPTEDEKSKDGNENGVEIKEIESIPYENNNSNEDEHLNETLKKNILSCVEKVARIEEMKKTRDTQEEQQDVVVRPVSVQSNGSAYSENEMWQNKMEMSQVRLNALKKQQKRLLQYQAEAKQQLEEMNRETERESQEIHPSTSHDNFANMPSQSFSNYNPPNRMYAANQIGVATTLPHSADGMHSQNSNIENDHSAHSQDERFSHRDANIASSEEAGRGDGGRDSEGEGEGEEEDEAVLGERARLLQLKIRELQLKKHHMETLVSEFQKLQMATRAGSSRNTYSSSGEDSGVEESGRKFSDNKSGGNIKNEDPFKLMEIKAIKTALQKTKDLMRSVENYEPENLSPVPDESFQMGNHSNIHDNKSEGGGSAGGWSTEGSVCRVRNSLPPVARHKLTNHTHRQSHEANISALQDLAQELRRETEKIMGERALIKDMANKEAARKQKKINEEVRAGPSTSGAPGPAERRQMQLRALLAEKQRELESLLLKEVGNGKILCANPETQNQKPESRTASVANRSYTSEQEEPDSRSEQIMMGSQNSHENDNFRGGADSTVARSVNTVSAHLGSAYGSDSDTASRNKNQRNRPRRRLPQERQSDEINNPQQNNANQNLRHEARAETSNVNLVPPVAQSDNPANMPYPHLPPPNWNSSKSNQDMRNQFTQNSHSQTMDRLLGTPQMSYPPSMPFNMMQMMPYGMVGGCGCGCGFWAAWSWQQVALQQREIHQLRGQLNHLEERWRAETASHTLNNQVPPGNRANNYWDNFRSYSRQNLLSANSKTNAEGGVSGATAGAGAGGAGGSQPHSPHPLAAAARSHNPLGAPSPGLPPAPAPPPDVLHTTPRPALSNLTSANLKKKSSSKLPAKNSRRNISALDYSTTSNINIASTSTAPQPNPNLASAARPNPDKATSKLFDLLRENVYSEVTTLIGVNESHPDFLIQLFRDLQLISSDPLRQRVLQSIRNVLTQYASNSDEQINDNIPEESRPEAVSTTNDTPEYHDNMQNPCTSSTLPMDNNILRFLLLKSDDVCTPEFLEALSSLILSKVEKPPRSKKKLLEILSKYEGLRVCDVTGDILESLPVLISGPVEEETGEAEGVLQDVAGSLNLFGGEGCPFDVWPGHVHVEGDEGGDVAQQKEERETEAQDHDGELAEADQRERGAGEAAGGAGDSLPDLVDAEETTPTEAEAGWLGLDRVPTRLHMEDSSEKQKD